MATTTVLLLVAAVGGCLAAVLAAGALGPVTFSADSPVDRLVLLDRQAGPGLLPSEPAPEDGVASQPRGDGDGGMPLEVVLSLAVTLVAGALLARALLRARHDPAEADEEAEDPTPAHDDTAVLHEVAGAARRALGRLDAEPAGAGEAVLACWVALEAAGARLGRGRVSTDTPSDFAGRLLAAAPGLDPAVLDDLRRTYSQVRYGREVAGPDQVRRAREALRHLLLVLDGSDAGDGAGAAPSRPGGRA